MTFEVTTTLDDHLALHRSTRRLSDRRRNDINILVGYGVVLPLIALAACFALLLLLRVSACDLDEALGDAGRVRFYGAILASLVGGQALVSLGLWLMRRAHLETSVRAQLARRPGIDTRDPTLAERNVVSLHAAGFRVATEGATYASSWTTTRYFDEVAEHFFVMAEENFGFIIPKRGFAPATILALRDMMLAFGKAKRD